MILKFNVNKPEEDEVYTGIIKKAVVSKNKDALRVYVEIDNFEGTYYMKYLPVSSVMNSNFYYFCDEMQIIRDNGEIDTNDLIGKEIVCTLNKVNDMFFINDIGLLSNYPELFEDCE